jgi:tetratricopeptide (TPR) repeat protein
VLPCFLVDVAAVLRQQQREDLLTLSLQRTMLLLLVTASQHGNLYGTASPVGSYIQTATVCKMEMSCTPATKTQFAVFFAALYTSVGTSCVKTVMLPCRAAVVYKRVADCQLQGDSKHEAASAYVEAANCYKKFSPQGAAEALSNAVNLFLEIGRLNMAARYSKDIGDTYQQEQDLENAVVYLNQAADLFDSERQSSQANSNVQVLKKFRQCTVPTISVLIHCCSGMLTSYYPVQIKVPVHTLISLIQRVLLVDGSLHNKMFPSTTSLHQEFICFELLSLHSTFLDLLIATIKGMRSHLLPHASSIIRLMTEYFQVAKLPTMRTKVYSIAQLLLICLGPGTSLHLLEVVVSNAVADLNDGSENDMIMFGTDPSVTTESTSQCYSKKRRLEPQMQTSVFSASEKAAMSQREKKKKVLPHQLQQRKWLLKV